MYVCRVDICMYVCMYGGRGKGGSREGVGGSVHDYVVMVRKCG